ncbi:hypothetical protein B0J18DRAFT_454106 [Chaetomium sp. MPI-SDFR-AT-0129]|nr:hypothetical protein B0J18DRAFT_454106 [Chaetomium sp. MPI-SDFR-AT-0129]
MGPSPLRSPRQGETVPPSPRRQNRTPSNPSRPSPRRFERASTALEGTKRKNLSRSVTEFFTKLRPSMRPERGGTARPTLDDAWEGQSPGAVPGQKQSFREKRSNSLNRFDPDSIPQNLWNTPLTPPRRADSVRARSRTPAKTQPGLQPNSPRRSQGSPSRRRPFLVDVNRPPRPPQYSSSDEDYLPFRPSSPKEYDRPSAPRVPSLQKPGPSSAERSPFHEKLAIRRERRTLISSGDFLGVTGVNPYTGTPDIITPPTSSDDAIVTSSSSRSSAQPALAQPRRASHDRSVDSHPKVQQVSHGRVHLLDDPEPEEVRKDSQPCELATQNDLMDMVPAPDSERVVSGQDPEFPSAYTHTIITTGSELGQSRRHGAAHPFGAILDESEGPLNPEALIPRIVSPTILPRFSATTTRHGYSGQLVSPSTTRQSGLRRSSSQDPQTTVPISGQNEMKIRGSQESPTPLLHLGPWDTNPKDRPATPTASVGGRKSVASTRSRLDDEKDHASGERGRPTQPITHAPTHLQIPSDPISPITVSFADDNDADKRSRSCDQSGMRRREGSLCTARRCLSGATVDGNNNSPNERADIGVQPQQPSPPSPGSGYETLGSEPETGSVGKAACETKRRKPGWRGAEPGGETEREGQPDGVDDGSGNEPDEREEEQVTSSHGQQQHPEQPPGLAHQPVDPERAGGADKDNKCLLADGQPGV